MLRSGMLKSAYPINDYPKDPVEAGQILLNLVDLRPTVIARLFAPLVSKEDPVLASSGSASHHLFASIHKIIQDHQVCD